MIKNFIFSCLFFVTIIPLQLKAFEEETVEVTYDELVEKIRSKQRNYTQKRAVTAWDQVAIYPSFAFIQTMTQVSADSKEDYFQKGLQIGIGMELFTPYWFSEAAYRNFGITKSKSYELSLKELDFKVGHKNLLSENIEFRISLGVSTRQFRLTNEETGFHNEEKNPALISSVGLFTNSPNSPVMLGAELNYRSLLVSSQTDKGSLGLNFIFMGYF